jgi:hypothetical protein
MVSHVDHVYARNNIRPVNVPQRLQQLAQHVPASTAHSVTPSSKNRTSPHAPSTYAIAASPVTELPNGTKRVNGPPSRNSSTICVGGDTRTCKCTLTRMRAHRTPHPQSRLGRHKIRLDELDDVGVRHRAVVGDLFDHVPVSVLVRRQRTAGVSRT